jgi:hypothetical protein
VCDLDTTGESSILKTIRSVRPCDVCLFVCYETIERELHKRLIHECRCDERLKVKPERSTRLGYTVYLFKLFCLFLVSEVCLS